MQLWLEPALTGTFYSIQHLSQQAQGFFALTRLMMGLREETEVQRVPDAQDSGPPVIQRQAFLKLAQLSQRAPATDMSSGEPVCKTLLGAEGNKGLRQILNGFPLVSDAMKPAQFVQDEAQGMRMCQPFAIRQCLAAASPCLIRIAQGEERRDQKCQCHRAMVVRVEGKRRTLRQGIVEQDHSLQVLARRCPLAEVVEGGA